MVNLTRLVVIGFATLLASCSLVNATSSHMGGASVDVGTDDQLDAAIDAPVGPDAGRVGPARVRVVHLARDTSLVNVFAVPTSSRVPLAAGLGFTSASTYVDAPEGMVLFEVERNGAPGGVVVSAMLGPLAVNTDYTLAFFGDEVDPPFGDRGAGILLLTDDASGLDTRRDIRLAIIHLASPVAEGQLVAIDPTGGFSVLAEDVAFQGVARLGALPAMERYRVGFDAEADDTIDVRFDLPDYFPGTYANVFIGARNDGSVFLYSVTGGSARVIEVVDES